MKITVVGPVLNECPWIGYSIMATLDYMHEFIYSLDANSSDGTRELLHHIKDKYAHEKLTILETPTFHPSDMVAYNASFNYGIRKATGEACWFLHPDMIVTNPEQISKVETGPLAWLVNVTSYAGDMKTVITKGRATQWKNIHANKFGLQYFGGYGSQNEDFYHSAITGKSYRHYGTEFSKYPYQIADSTIAINHYCETKPYKRRLEKMKLCLRTLAPTAGEEWIEESATQHPRVTLEPSCTRFGDFKFESSDKPLPEVFETYKEFEAFRKEEVYG